MATHTSPEWAWHALSNDISNTTTERFNLYRKFMGPISGLQQSSNNRAEPVQATGRHRRLPEVAVK